MSKPMIHNADELEALAQRMGLLPFFSCGIPGFSIEDFTPSRFWFAEGVDGPWEWRMDVARRGVVAYGKLFHNKAGLVSREWYPDLANYRRDGYDFDARYEDGLAGYKEKCIMDVLLRDGPTLSKDLKKAAGFGGGGMKDFDTAITRLQMQTYVTVHSFEYIAAPPRSLASPVQWPGTAGPAARCTPRPPPSPRHTPAHALPWRSSARTPGPPATA